MFSHLISIVAFIGYFIGMGMVFLADWRRYECLVTEGDPHARQWLAQKIVSFGMLIIWVFGLVVITYVVPDVATPFTSTRADLFILFNLFGAYPLTVEATASYLLEPNERSKPFRWKMFRNMLLLSVVTTVIPIVIVLNAD